MGANAQTSVPLFVANTVLTAAQQNISAATGVPVFATTVTRDAAFGGSNKVLAEGQLCYLESTDVVQYYTGSAWATLAPSASGLTLVSATTIGSAVSSVTVSSAFSATYDNYLITATGGAGSGTVAMKLTLGSTATGYYYNLVYQSYNAATPTGSGGSNTTNWLTGYASTTGIDCTINLQSPNLAKNTLMSFSGALASTTGENSNGRGYLADTTQYTAFTLTPNSGTLTGGTVRVYGYQNS